MAIIFKRSAGWKWTPDSDEINASDGVLLRADNTIPEELGARRLRRGSKTLYSGLDGSAHSLYTAQLQGNLFRIVGAGDSLYVNGDRLATGLDGVGDMSFCDDSYQAFIARGSLKKKWDGETLNNWGFAAPVSAPTLTAIDAIKYEACSFNDDESPALTVNEASNGTGSPPTYASVFVPNWADPADTANYNATGAMSLTPKASSGRASVSKKWSSSVDFLNFLGNAGGASDLFDIRVWMEEPRKVDKVTIMFGMSTGKDPFLDDYYYFDFNVKNTGTVDIKDAASSTAAAYGVSNKALQSPLTPQQITKVKSPADAGKVLRALGRFAGSRSRERADTQAASPAWGHLSVTRGQFNRVGGTPGRDWRTVRGFKVIYTALPGATEKLYLDEAIWTGGGNRALTGTFQVGLRFARRFNDKKGAEIYTELSPMSKISKPITLQQQTLEVNIPASTLAMKDGQVNQVWVYLYGGWLDTYYRVAILPAAAGGGMTTDDLSDPNNLDDPSEWVRLNAYGFTKTTNASTEIPDLKARIFKSELEALIENEVFEAGSVGPPDNIVSVAGPWNKRVFCLTEEGWLYPSSQKCPSSFSLYQCIDLRLYGDPLWVVKTVTGVFVGMSKDIVRIAGSGDQDEQNLLADLYPQPLNVANPPIDRSVAIDGNSIYYRSADGPMVFSGASAEPVPYSGTSLMWKGYDRYEVPALDTINGRFRYAMDDHSLYMLVAEGGSPTATIAYMATVPRVGDKTTIDTRTYRFVSGSTHHDGEVLVTNDADSSWTNLVNAINGSGGSAGDYQVASPHPYVTATIDTSANVVTLSAVTHSRLHLYCSSPYAKESRFEAPCTSLWKFYGDEWCRFTYGANTICSIHREYDGNLVAGTYEGNVLLIENGELDSDEPIYVEMLTPYTDGDSPIARKDPADIQIHGMTGGSTGTLNIYTDASRFPSQPTKTLPFSMMHDGIYRGNLIDLDVFMKLQVEILGNMTALSLHGIGLSYTPRPPHAMSLNLGRIIPPDSGDLAWINQVEVELISNYDVELEVFKNGRLHTTQTITVNPGVRDVYTVGLPRETKGRRLDMRLRTTQGDGEGFLGFEAYMVRVRHAATGNVTELPLGQGDARSDQNG